MFALAGDEARRGAIQTSLGEATGLQCLDFLGMLMNPYQKSTPRHCMRVPIFMMLQADKGRLFLRALNHLRWELTPCALGVPSGPAGSLLARGKNLLRSDRNQPGRAADGEKFGLHSKSGLKSAPPKAKNQMPAKTPKPRFKHQPVRGMPERVESYCMLCGQFIAASDKPGTLRIADTAHICPKRKT